MQSLVLIRGLPGSGKSTMAKALAGFTHLEADMFFMNNGKYQFDKNKLKEAHVWCQHQVEVALKHGESVVVSNTFTKQWEMEPYLRLAAMFKIPAHIMCCYGNFPNIHDVPKETIAAMAGRWEYIIT